MDKELLHSPPWLLAVTFFGLILLSLRLGTAYRKYQVKKAEGEWKEGWGVLHNAMLTLLGLLLAFTFGMAVSKFENRRAFIVEEANDIGTAILRCDMYPDSIRAQLKQHFKHYVQARIDYFEAGKSEDIQSTLDAGSKYSSLIWNEVIALSRDPKNLASTLQMVPAVNAMIDIAAAREAERKAKVPRLILITLLLLTLIGSFFIGYDQLRADRSGIFVLGFAFMISLTIYLILELDRARTGLINLRGTEKMIEDLLLMFDKDKTIS